MKNMELCRFCNIIKGEYQYCEIDRPFASNDKYIAVASIGALIRGWSLIIPKEHQLSLRNVYDENDFLKFTGTVISLLMNQYGPLIAFEHGSNKEGSITACGTDHAHLHLVPFNESLVEQIQTSGLKWIQRHISEIKYEVGEREYLFYTELKSEKSWHDPVGYLHILKSPISQFFRHLIASRLGNDDMYDYKRFPYLENAKQTRIVLAG